MRTPDRFGLFEIMLGLAGLGMVVGVLAAQSWVDRETAEAISMTQTQAGR